MERVNNFPFSRSTLAMSSFIPIISSASGGSFDIHNRNANNCIEGTVLVYSTFIPDNATDELTWEIHVTTSAGDFISIEQGQPLKIPASVTVDKLCINKMNLSSSTNNEFDRFLGVKKKTDKGLKRPCMTGLSIHGRVILSVNKTNWYVNTFSVNVNNRYFRRASD